MGKILKILTLTAVFLVSLNAAGFPKSYYKMHVSQQKKYFFNFFEKRIVEENMKIIDERDFIVSLKGNKNLSKTSKEYKKLQKLQKKYKIKNLYDYKKYLLRVDIVPVSMALAQAATESGWGKSRFFKQANNIFGHWTYNKKIGMVPLRRAKGKKHLIRIFPNLQASISAYMLNLNRTGAYKEFRIKRAKQRKSGTYINGMKLSSTMTRYSGIGHNYVKILQSIIRKSKLVYLDKQQYLKIQNQKITRPKELNEIYSPY